MNDVIQKLLIYLTYHSFINEALIEEGQICFTINIDYDNETNFINRFTYLSIIYKNNKFCIENENLELLEAAAELEKFLVG
jgi:hypothetical protein